jgi:CPA1 family monovalent cation:H+ antiporter
VSLGLTFVLLFTVATAVALVARRFAVPYTVSLVVTGLALGATRAFGAPPLTKELLFTVFLPGLLFEAAFHLPFASFWNNKTVVLSLAIPGVGAATLLTAALLTPSANALHFVESFSLGEGLVFGALICATDPIAVVGLFRALGVPERLAVLVEGESLLNDGTAAVLFSLAASFVVAGGGSVETGALAFASVVGVGLLAGALVSLLASKVIQRIDDPMIEITLTTIAAYGSFVLAEVFHGSGVIATVCAGMVCGNYAARTGMSPSTRLAVETFWEYVAFALNSIVFLLIGFEVPARSLLESWRPIVVAYVAATLGRAVVIALVAALLSRTRERLTWSWTAVLTWGGLRGALSMVLALGLAPEFPNRSLLVTMTFGVVILSILLQGLSMSPLLRWLGIAGRRDEWERYEERRARMGASQAALRSLDRMAGEKLAHPDVIASFRKKYEQSMEEAEKAMHGLEVKQAELRGEVERAVHRQLLLVQKEHLVDSLRAGRLGRHAFEAVLRDLDAELWQLESGEAPRDSTAERPG